MSAGIDSFIAEIRNSPEYVEAAAESGTWIAHIDNIEHGLNEIDRRAHDDPAMAEAIDKIIEIISDDDQHMGRRLHDLGALVIRLHEIKGKRQ
jgi:hypothetical protein